MLGLKLNNLYIIILAAIFSGLIIYFVYLRAIKYINKYKRVLNLYKQKTNTLRHEILAERLSVDLHREELLATTEHLQELNVELEQLSLVASETDTAVAIADHKGRINFVNKGFINLFGYTLPEIYEKFGRDIYTIGKGLNILPVSEKLGDFTKGIDYTTIIKTKKGTVKWVKTTLNPIFDDKGKIKQYILLETDVSEIKAVNDKLEKLSLVASNTNNSVIIFDSNSEIDWVNDGFHNMYGYGKVEFINKYGKTIKDFLAHDNKSEVYNEVVNTRDSVSYVSNFVDREGIEKWKQSSLTPILKGDDKLHEFILVESDITRIKAAEMEIQLEKEKSEKLLLNILPEETAQELKKSGIASPRLYRSASVLFADIQDFSRLAEYLTPVELVSLLHTYFSRFDDTVSSYFVEKIKTIGDAFLCVGGIPMKNNSHAFDTVMVALELQRIILDLGKEREELGKRPVQFRIGIHTGPIIAGVVGKQKMTYDIWGDTVNIAKRIESSSVAGMVNISASTYEIIKDYFECENRGKVLVKQKGHIDMYFVHRLKPEFSVNSDGVTPNNYFMEMLAQL